MLRFATIVHAISKFGNRNGDDENSLEQPNKVVPKEQNIKVQNSVIRASLPGNSLTVIRIPTGKS